ncbi:MAG: ATP-grasp domain-containing protein [Micropruina sp.]|uniref:ATP-grasp domain-containing protein n=1 Tax=Micropruina sp. TaxID=2737536 RepID=UPI0039E66D7E
MSHLLMVESWVAAMSALLPRAIHETGHQFSFLTRDLHHYLRQSRQTPHPLLAARNVLTAETNDIDALWPWLDRARDLIPFDGAITSCDYYLTTVARIAERYGLPGPRPEAIATCLNKDRSRAAFAAAGIPGPQIRAARDWPAARAAAEEIGYPVVIKPTDLCGGMLVRRVDDEAGLRAAYEQLAAATHNSRQQLRSPVVLIEEFLTGPEVSVESVTVGGATHVIGATDKSIVGDDCFVETGHMFPAALDDETAGELADLARAAVAAVGLTDCISHLEVKLTPHGPRIVELNPRPAGNRISELIRRVTGIDLACVHAQLAAGDEPDLRHRDTGLGSAAVHMLLPSKAGTVVAVTGVDRLRGGEVVEYVVPEPGARASAPRDNNCYLGRVMVVDPEGRGARSLAEGLVADLDIVIEADPSERTA